MTTTEDLRRSLSRSAGQYEPPDPTSLVQAVSEQIGREPTRMRHVVAAAAAVALVAAGGYALSQGLGEDETSTEVRPAETTWELVDGAPPEYADGLHLVGSTDVEYADASATLPVPEREESREGDPLFAVAWCDLGPAVDSAAVIEPEVTLTVAGEHVTTPCGGRGASVASAAPQPVPTDGGELEISLAGDLPTEGTATVALYEEAAVGEYPYPQQTDAPEPPAAAGNQVLDASTPPTAFQSLEPAGGFGQAHAIEVTTGEAATARVWAGEPGTLLLTVNGVSISNDGEELSGVAAQPGPWDQADPALRGGRWFAWAPGATQEFELSPRALAEHGIQVQDGETVTVAALASFPRSHWQVMIAAAGPVVTATSLPPVGDSEVLPEYAYGLQQVVAVEVPADGRTHTVDLGGADPEPVTWVAECEYAPGGGPGTVRIGDRETFCRPGAAWLNLQISEDSPAGSPVQVSASISEGPVQLAAYRPLDWDGYPFAESETPLAGATEQPQDGARLREYEESRMPNPLTYREVARVTSEHLDESGRTVVQVPSSRDLAVLVSTEGVVRTRASLGDESLFERMAQESPDQRVAVRDGWFSQWTTGSASFMLRPYGSLGSAPHDHPTVTVEVDGREGARAELVFFEIVPEDELGEPEDL